MIRIFTFTVFVNLFSFSLGFSADIKGTIKDNDGATISGVSIYAEGTSKGAISNKNGEYLIKDIPDGNYFIITSIIGYKKERTEINVTGNIIVTHDFVMQQVSVKLGEIVVTTDKREENLENLPISVSAISSQQFGDLNIRQRTDLMAVAPNTLVGESGSHMTDLINIRGMVGATPFASTSLFCYDGVAISSNLMHFNDIERVEIIRGPQGTMYGVNTLAGVINVIPKKPSNITSYDAGIIFGNYHDMNFNFGISTPLIKDKLFFRAAGYYYSKDGYFTNTFHNSNSGGLKGSGGDLSIRYFPSETFNVEFFTNIEYINENIWPFAANPDSALSDPYKIQRNIDSYQKETNITNFLKLNFKLDFMDIISISDYNFTSGQDWLYDADFSQYDLIAFHQQNPFNGNFSEELRFESNNFPSNLKWVGGLYYNYGNSKADYAAIIGSLNIKNMGIPDGYLNSLSQVTTGPSSGSNYAIFGQATYTIFDKLNLTAGLRYELQDIKTNTRTVYDYTSNVLPHPIPVGVPQLAPFLFLNNEDSLNKSKQFGFVAQKYAADYILTENDMVYVSVSSGYNGGGFNSGSNKTHPYYDPEFTWNYEAGYKTTLLHDMLRINASVFFIDWRDQQLLIVGNLSSPLQTISNAGRTQNKGFELETWAIPLKGLTLNLSLGYVDAKYKNYTFYDSLTKQQYDYSGKQIPFTPKLSSSLRVKYEYPVKLFEIEGNLTINLEHQYMDPYYSSHLNKFRTTARNLLNGNLGFITKYFDISV
jgi:iron complex outermembrane receptor protein